MPAGRPPLPNQTKRMRGTIRPCRTNANEPCPTAGIPKCPAFLDRVAKAKWKQIAEELDRLGMLTIVDGDSLACYCQAWAEFEWATKELRKGRTVERGTGALAPHPAVAMQRSAWKAIQEFSTRFGLDPSSRGKLNVPVKAPEDPMAKFFTVQPTGECG